MESTLLDFPEWIWARATGNGTAETNTSSEVLHQRAVDSVNDVSCSEVLRIGGLGDQTEMKKSSKRTEHTHLHL
jgi:hypothetical protein